MKLRRCLALTTLVFALACSSSKDNDNNNSGGDNDSGGDNVSAGDDVLTGDPDGGDTFSTAPISATDLCAIFAQAQVGEESECGETFPSVTADAKAAQCAAGGDAQSAAAQVLDSVNNNRISIDWAKARQCNAEARALRAVNSPIALSVNASWIALRTTGACAHLAAGLVDTNGACVNSADCKNATDECSQDEPHTGSAFTCRPLAALDAPCDNVEIHCAAGLGCPAGTCVAPTTPCAGDEDCVDGVCDSGTCVADGSVALGGACTAARSCAGYCSTCTQLPAEDHTTCKTQQASGGACATRDDCADGLGCTGNVCTTVTIGGDCNTLGGSNDICAGDASCEGGFDCASLDGNEGDCSSHAPYCNYDEGDDTCKFGGTGKCVVRPTSGACLAEYLGTHRCASGIECITNDSTCHAQAALSQACDNSLTNAPSCGNSLYCDLGSHTCVASCDSNSDCPSGQYCNGNSAPAVCADVLVDDCDYDYQCGEGRFCADPGDVCATYVDETSCSANADCTYDEGSSTCGISGSAHTHCRALGQPGEFSIGACETASGDVGYSGTIGESQTCVSQLCEVQVGGAPAICISTPSSCLNFPTAELLSVPFLFGLVRLRRRKRRA